MKEIRLVLVGFALVGLMTACGGTPQEESPALDEAQVVEPTPVFEDDFETGEAESWGEDEKAEAEADGQGAEEEPAE